MPSYTCSNCPYFKRTQPGGGDCRRNPPVPILAPTKLGPQVMAFFAGVANSQYCFEHPSLKAMAGEMAASRLQFGNLKPAGEAMQIPQQGNGQANDAEAVEDNTEDQPDFSEVQAADEVEH